MKTSNLHNSDVVAMLVPLITYSDFFEEYIYFFDLSSICFFFFCNLVFFKFKFLIQDQNVLETESVYLNDTAQGHL